MLPLPGEPSREGAKARRGGRVSSACLQCRRLKRKCDRQWPCKHCLARRIAHQCQFGDPKQDISASSKRILANDGETTLEDGLESSAGSAYIEIPAALKALGYMGSDLFTGITPCSPCPNTTTLKDPPTGIQEALRAVPPRSYTDDLVSAYFSYVNYHYEVIHQPTFIVDYAAWWGRRASRAVSDVALTSLVLQMCALGAQFIGAPTSQKLELEMGESVENIGVRMHEAAQRLSTFIPPGEGGMPLIQQLFLAGGWLKNRVEITKSWHFLCSAVREAQEIGLHTDSAAQEISLCEREVRRRMWYILNIWDTTFSSSFGRPRIIQELGQVPPANPRFELAESASYETSAAAVILCEWQLWEFLSNHSGESRSPHAKIKFVEDWIHALPTMYTASSCGATDNDSLFANNFRRIKLHCMGYAALLACLRPYLTIPSDPKSINTESRNLRDIAVQTAIHLMRISKEFFVLCYPIHSKYFFVQFCPFDTASTLCSALHRDASRTWIVQRLEVVEALGSALYISDRLKNLTRMGDAMWNILTTMVLQMDLSAVEQQIMERSRHDGSIGHIDAASPPGRGIDEADQFGSPFLRSISDLLTGNNIEIEAFMNADQGSADMNANVVGVGYNGSNVMALEELMNNDMLDGDWIWSGIDPRFG